MSPFLRIASMAALEAGKVLLRHSQHIDQLKVQAKGLNDLVSNADLECAREIVERLRRAYPEHRIVEEEGVLESLPPIDDAVAPDTNLPATQLSISKKEQHASDMCWVIDPIDGTTNFVRGLAHCAISIALLHKQQVVLGLVYNPFKDEMFTAEKDGGAVLNRTRIRVSQCQKLSGSVLATGVPYRREQDSEHYLQTLQAMINSGANIRRMGAASLDLCYVACGRFDGFWEYGLRAWDIAAGSLIVEEAGGICVDLGRDRKPVLQTGNILASSTAIYEEMWKLNQKPSE